MTTTTLPDRRIADLLAVPAEQYDLAWLKNSLQVAIELELSTLPPYLCGYWSCQQQQDPAAQLINSVILQEMLHMGLAANMLTSIGGVPAINTAPPSYPSKGLPGGVLPSLTVYLGGLTTDYIGNVYMGIEYPEKGPITSPPVDVPTIGQFYSAISTAFSQVNPSFSGTNQMTATIGQNTLGQNNVLNAVTSLTDAQAAITEITEQGEGSSTSPDDEGSELAHYYRFGEIFNGKQLVLEGNSWVYQGAAVPFPSTYPMAEVPAGGWPNPPDNVSALLKTFDATYKVLLDNLQGAWENGNATDLGTAIGAMFDLGNTAGQLMQIELVDGTGTYGPDFIYPISNPPS